MFSLNVFNREFRRVIIGVRTEVQLTKRGQYLSELPFALQFVCESPKWDNIEKFAHSCSLIGTIVLSILFFVMVRNVAVAHHNILQSAFLAEVG